MEKTVEALRAEFVIVDLGSADSRGLARELGAVAPAVTLIELDAVAGSSSESGKYYKVVKLSKIISGTLGKRPFYKRRLRQGSSFLVPKTELLKAYGLEEYFELDQESEVECTTLPAMAKELQLEHIDFLKTDLEGLDLEILTSSSDLVSRALVVQSESRFQPFFVGEASFCDLSGFLIGRGFELITLRPEAWKYKTSHRNSQRDGRIVMADSVFFLSMKRVEEIFGEAAPNAYMKQIVLAKALGLSNYGEWILQNTGHRFPGGLRDELSWFLNHSHSMMGAAIRLTNAAGSMPVARTVIRRLRLALSSLVKIMTFHRDHPHVGTL